MKDDLSPLALLMGFGGIPSLQGYPQAQGKSSRGMRKIVLSEEEKKRIELRVTEKAIARKGRSSFRKKNRVCPKCKRVFDRSEARKNHHRGYCSVQCNPGGKPIYRKSKAERRAAKKIRTLRKRQANQILNRVKSKSPEDFYDSREWREIRYKILRKFGFKCMACGAKPGDHPLHVDHIKPRSKYPDLELDEFNLQVLCRDCNLGKSNVYQDDLRPDEMKEPDFLTEAAKSFV